MVVLVAPDKFKGSLTAAEVAAFLRTGLSSVGVESVSLPLADGGDGSVDAAVSAGFARRSVTVPNALGVLHETSIAERGSGVRGSGLRGSGLRGSTVVVEVANTCGLATLPAGVLRPLDASSAGVGEAVRQALLLRPSTLVLALGGSASTDGGMGLLAALGLSFLDATGAALPPCGRSLPSIARVTGSVEVAGVEIVVAGDVTNPLTGPDGSAAVYGPQKGAAADDVRLLDDGLTNLVARLTEYGFPDCSELPGAGAAGGIGYAALLLGGRMESGASYFLDLLDFDSACATADLVVTAEGSIDDQTSRGKLLSVLAARAGSVPVVAVGGRNTLSAAGAREIGFRRVYAVSDYTDRDTAGDPELTGRLLTGIGQEIGSTLGDLVG